MPVHVGNRWNSSPYESSGIGARAKSVSLSYYKGDGRSFSYDLGTSRMKSSFVVSIDPAYPQGEVGPTSSGYGITAGYNNETDALGNGNDIFMCSEAVCPGFCTNCLTPWATAECGPTVAIPGQGGNVLSTVFARDVLDPSLIGIGLDLVGFIPCGWVAPAIDVHVGFEFRQVCANGVYKPMEWRIKPGAWHDGFPWHELYVNVTQVYKWDPCVDPVTGGPRTPNPNDLFPSPIGQDISIPTSLNQWRPVP